MTIPDAETRIAPFVNQHELRTKIRKFLNSLQKGKQKVTMYFEDNNDNNKEFIIDMRKVMEVHAEETKKALCEAICKELDDEDVEARNAIGDGENTEWFRKGLDIAREIVKQKAGVKA